MAKRLVEVFSAGCEVCEDAVAIVKATACESCDVQVLDMKKPEVQAKARRYGIARVPAVVVNGQLASCCSVGAVDAKALRQHGVGVRA